MLITGSTFATFALTAALIEITPGPNLAYLAVLSATTGRRAGYAATAGIALGLTLLGLAAAAGLAGVIAASPLAFATLRWCGIAYLLWLAWEAWQASTEAVAQSPANAEGVRVYFNRGLWTNLLNPKAAIFYVSLLPTFIDASRATLGQSITLSLLHVAIATGVHASIVTLAGTMQSVLTDPARIRRTRQFLALTLVAIAFWFALTTGR